MYNLLVGFREGSAFGNRVLEHTDDAIQAYIAPAGQVDPARLTNLPTMVMPETGNSNEKQVARVGHIEDLRLVGGDYKFRFVPNSQQFAEIPSHRIEQIADQLGIADDWEFIRTHWAVKDVDLYRVLRETITEVKLAPSAFRFPTEVPRDDNLVAVMMPFESRFNPVYDALKSAVDDAGFDCHRADDIWEADHIMDDVIGLIWRARAVIADLSAKNPNVFYETGIAHSLGRDVILIAQSIEDVPFDLRPIRSLVYHSNGEGLRTLRTQVTSRLAHLAART